jgi:hypothetical protein
MSCQPLPPLRCRYFHFIFRHAIIFTLILRRQIFFGFQSFRLLIADAFG